MKGYLIKICKFGSFKNFLKCFIIKILIEKSGLFRVLQEQISSEIGYLVVLEVNDNRTKQHSEIRNPARAFSLFIHLFIYLYEEINVLLILLLSSNIVVFFGQVRYIILARWLILFSLITVQRFCVCCMISVVF